MALLELDPAGSSLRRTGQSGADVELAVLPHDDSSAASRCARQRTPLVCCDITQLDPTAVRSTEVATGKPLRTSIHLPIVVGGMTRAVLALALPHRLEADALHLLGLLEASPRRQPPPSPETTCSTNSASRPAPTPSPERRTGASGTNSSPPN